jgi:hypothetical protein
MNNHIISKRKEILMLFDLLCDKIDEYIIYENLSLNYNNNNYNSILKNLEKIYSLFEKNLTNIKYFNKL